MLDRYVSLVLIAVSGAGLYNAVKLADGVGGVRGALFPLVITVGLGILSILLLVSTFRPATARSGAPAGSTATATTATTAAAPPQQTRQSLIFFGLVILYIVAIKPLGFLVSSAVAGTLILRLAFQEKWWQSVLIAFALAFAGWFLFKQVLLVPLPDGTLLKGVIGG